MVRLALVLLLAASSLPAQQGVPEQLRVAAFGSTRAHDALLWLSDRIGGRLTGSEAHERAAAWVSEQVTAAGLRLRLGPVSVPSTWQRGDVALRVVAPEERELPAEAAGWTPAVDGELRGAVVVDPEPGAEVGKRIVLVDPTAVPLLPRGRHPYRDAALVLVDGQRPYALVPTGLATWAGTFVPTDVPAAFLAAPDAAWIRRQAAAGQEVVITASGGGRLGEAAEVADVLADIPGVGEDGRAEEIVLAAVGLDSWDVGTGAVADAAGVAVALEAARLLAGLDGRPQRTIRFAFLAGSAQGLGTTAYAARLDDASVARHVGGFVLEGGGGRLLGLALDGSEAHLEPVERWFAPVRFLGFTDVGYRPSRTAMPRALQERGVPVFAFVQEVPELAWVVGTRADTPDRVLSQDLQQAACVLATGLWAIANERDAPVRFPR